jgi:hypothetical protein
MDRNPVTDLNLVVIFALVSWPVVALWLYRTRPVIQATLWTIMGAHLLLPPAAYIKISMIPQLDKYSISSIAALLGCALALRRPLRFWYGLGLAEILLFVLLVSPMVTSLLNEDPIAIGGSLILPGSSAYDGGSAIILQAIHLIPFFIGRQILRTEASAEEILRVLVIAGLAYSLPMLFEIRMSPQLQHWIYGYDLESFWQQTRGGGYRPVVFMGHGLATAFFLMTTAVAAATFWRTGTPLLRGRRLPLGGITAYLSAVLVLCKSLTALLYGITSMTLVRFARPKLQVRVALVLVTLALSYPILRAEDLVPTEAILNLAAASLNPERVKSLETRFTNERDLLDRASLRFWFGWGRFGRNLIYNPENGQNMRWPDGRWVITMGEIGFVGFLAEFGLLVLSVFRAAASVRFIESARDKAFFCALMLILAVNIFDLLPNSGLLPWTWLLAGALLGRAEALAIYFRLQKSRIPLSGQLPVPSVTQ